MINYEMNRLVVQKKIFSLFLFIICLFYFTKVSFGDIIAPGYSSHSIDFTRRYVFIATDYGIATYDKKMQRWETIPPKIHEKNIILKTKYTYPPTDSFLSVKVHNNEVWFGSYGKGAYKYDVITGKLSHYEGYHKVYDDKIKKEVEVGNCELPDNVINSIVVDKRNNVWFATNCGVSILSHKGWKNYLSKECKPSERNVFPPGNITSMDIDQSGHIWVGRSNFHNAYYDASPPEMIVDGGVSLFNGEKWIHYYARNYDLQNPDESNIKTELISNNVRCLVIDKEEVYIGTRKGLSVFNQKTKKWRSYTKENSGIISNSITSIAIGKNAIWIGTVSGISKYDKSNNMWINYGKKILPFPCIQSIGYDKYDKDIWAVTCLYAYTDIYVYRFDGINWDVFPTRKRIRLKTKEELFKLGIFLKEREIKEEAKNILSEISRKYPRSKIGIQAQYEILTTWGDINALKKFQKKYPKSPYALEIQLKIADRYFSQGNYQQAIKEYHKLIKKSRAPKWIYQAKYGIAKCYNMLKNYQKEIQLLEEIYNSLPNDKKRTDILLPHRIAKIYMDQLKEYRKAIVWFERGNGTDGETILQIGKCYELLGEYKKAIETYNRIEAPSWKFDEAKKKIIELEYKLGIKKKYPIKSIELDEFDKNLVWFVSEGGEIWKYNKNIDKLFNFRIGTVVKDILITKRNVWVKTEKKIIKISKENNQIREFPYLGNIAFDGEIIWLIDFIKEKHYIEYIRILRYNEANDELHEMKFDSIKLYSDNYKIIPDGEFVWLYGGTNLLGYTKRDNIWLRCDETDYSLIFKASEENFLWFDSEDVFGASQGIYRFDKKTYKWKLFPRVYAERVIPTKNYTWFISHYTNGLIRYDRKFNKFELFPLPPQTQHLVYPTENIFFAGNNLWVLSHEGISQCDEDTGKWDNIYHSPSYFEYTDFQFLTTENSNIWFIYQEYDCNLYRFNTITKKWDVFKLPLSNVTGFKIDGEYAWIISNGEVFKYNLVNNEIESIKLN